jgi:translation initiation factor IF-3
VEEDPQKHKIISSKEIKMRPIESTSLKIAIRNMQKELDEVKKENSKIKTSIKFTTIAELEVERDNILEETVRLREMLEE